MVAPEAEDASPPRGGEVVMVVLFKKGEEVEAEDVRGDFVSLWIPAQPLSRIGCTGKDPFPEAAISSLTSSVTDPDPATGGMLHAFMALEVSEASVSDAWTGILDPILVGRGTSP